MRKGKRFLVLLLAVSILVSSEGMGVYASEAETIDANMQYESASSESETKDINSTYILAGKKMTVLYTPEGQKPVPKVVTEDRRLVLGQDFEVFYYLLDVDGMPVGEAQSSVRDIGTYKLVLRGINGFSGEFDSAAVVTVKPRSLSEVSINVDNMYVDIDGEDETAEYEIRYQNCSLEENVDYVVADILKSEDGSKVTFIFEGKGNYSGRIGQEFHVLSNDVVRLSDAYKIASVDKQIYTGEEIEPVISIVKMDDTAADLQENIDYEILYADNVNAGIATVTVKGKGDYAGRLTGTFEIIPQEVGTVTEKEKEYVTLGNIQAEIQGKEFTYTGKVCEPAISVTVNGIEQKLGRDYNISYQDEDGNNISSKDTGTYYAVVTLQGNYTGTITFEYVILPAMLENVVLEVPTYTYTGKEIVPTIDEIQITFNGYTFLPEEMAGLSIKAENNVNATEKATVAVNGTGNFTGEIVGEFTINPKSISDESLEITVGGQKIVNNTSEYKVEWDGTAKTPEVVIRNGEVQLTLGKDYTCVYRYNTEIGTARAIVTGMGNYQGIRTVFFEITGKEFTEENNILVSIEEGDFYYSGQKITPEVVVKNGDVCMTEGRDYNVFYSNNVNAGTAGVLVIGVGEYSGTISKNFTILPKSIEQVTDVKVAAIPRQRYTREVIVPAVSIEVDGERLIQEKDYIVTVENAVEAGMATAIVVGKGNYKGVLAQQNFEIYKTTITYILNGGVNSPNNPDCYTATDAITLSEATKDAFNFEGWYLDKACTKKVTGIKMGTEGDLIFYAKWKPKQVYGVDISKWQNQANSSGAIDFQSVKGAGKAFAMIRICDGTSLDPYFEYNYSGARNAGMKVGVYCYNRATTVESAVAQANYVLEKLKGRVLDYPVCLDMEGDSSAVGALTDTERTDIVFAFKNVVEAAGYDFILYANKNWLDNYFDNPRLAPLDLWIARYCDYNLGHRYTGSGNVRIWQYTSEGTVNGISGRVDLDVCYEDYEKK